jgi:glycosyltransferase involved in cell wall biosynthesis
MQIRCAYRRSAVVVELADMHKATDRRTPGCGRRMWRHRGALFYGTTFAGAGEIEWLGAVSHSVIGRLLTGETIPVDPSQWYENVSCVVFNAFAQEMPVVVLCLGSMPGSVEDGVTGAHFRAGDAGDLAASVHAILADPRVPMRMPQGARRTFERKLTADVTHDMLISIYARALAAHRQSAASPAAAI